MDPSSQVFATGGASGIVLTALYLIYRFFFSKHRIVSKCCGREFSLETEASTPNIKTNPVVENASASPPNETQPSLTDGVQPVGKRRAGSVCGKDEVAVSQDRSGENKTEPPSGGGEIPTGKSLESKSVPEHS
jgi:hypothetical protein